MDPITLNLLYAGLGGVLLILFGWASVRFFRSFMQFRISDELQKGNVAVGLAVMGIFIGIGVGMGLVIGLSLN